MIKTKKLKKYNTFIVLNNGALVRTNICKKKIKYSLKNEILNLNTDKTQEISHNQKSNFYSKLK